MMDSPCRCNDAYYTDSVFTSNGLHNMMKLPMDEMKQLQTYYEALLLLNMNYFTLTNFMIHLFSQVPLQMTILQNVSHIFTYHMQQTLLC